MINNLFNYATSELSQDAFICWLCSFAHKKVDTEPELKKCAKELIWMFVPECDKKDVIITDIERQVEHVDVLLTMECENEKYKIIVEDKTYTREHDNQLKKYLEAIKKSNPDCHVRGVYYKTGFQGDLSAVEEAEYKSISRKEMLNFMHPYTEKTQNQIFLDYYEYWSNFQKKSEEYKSRSVTEWEYEQINGFYDFLKSKYDTSSQNFWTDYGYVANPSGGFYGLWTGTFDSKFSINGKIYELYLQIESKPAIKSYDSSEEGILKTPSDIRICLKLSAKDNVDKSALLQDRNSIIYDENWHYQLGKYNFSKPNRLSVGKHMTLGVYALNCEKAKDFINKTISDKMKKVKGLTYKTISGKMKKRKVFTYKTIWKKMKKVIKDYLKLLSDIKQNDNKFAKVLLDTIISPEKRKLYNRVVLICKNEKESDKVLKNFKKTCEETKIEIINGFDMMSNKIAFSKKENAFVMFENLQSIAGNPTEEQRFYEIYNLLHSNSIPMIITLSNEPRFLNFEGKNYERLNWGIKAEIT